jgi:hypothetical protein
MWETLLQMIFPGRKTHLDWERECAERIDSWHEKLKIYADNHDDQALNTLKKAVDAQLAIAELKLKVRQADWAKTMVWFPLIFPTLGAILGGFLGGSAH